MRAILNRFSRGMNRRKMNPFKQKRRLAAVARIKKEQTENFDHIEICVKGSDCGGVVKNHKTGKIYLFNSIEEAERCINWAGEKLL